MFPNCFSILSWSWNETRTYLITPTLGVVRVCFEKRPSGEIQLLAYPTQETMDRIPGPLAESMPLRLKCSSGETIKKNGDELSIGIGVGTYLMLILFPNIPCKNRRERGGGGVGWVEGWGD